MFVFFNDFITINGKVSKGDSVKVFVKQYENQGSKIVLNKEFAAKATLIVRGTEKRHDEINGYETLERLYDHVSALYKEHFYFGDSQ